MQNYIPLEESEQERLEQALFIDIVRLAPEGTDLVITTDSWRGLPSLFGDYMAVREGEWVVALKPAAREFLVQQALSDNIQTKFVHFFIVENGTEILTSYDGMCGMKLETKFPDYERVIAEYASLGIIMV
jgi:hypothetical protein